MDKDIRDRASGWVDAATLRAGSVLGFLAVFSAAAWGGDIVGLLPLIATGPARYDPPCEQIEARTCAQARMADREYLQWLVGTHQAAARSAGAMWTPGTIKPVRLSPNADAAALEDSNHGRKSRFPERR